MPSKLTNMMASGKAVVATVAENSQIDNELGACGVVAEPENVEACCNAIKSLVDKPEEARRLGGNCRQYVELHWSKYDVLAKVFA